MKKSWKSPGKLFLKKGTNPVLHVSFWNEMLQSTPANRPILIGIVPIFEFQNRKKLGHSDFQEEKKKIFFCKNLELGC